MFGAFGHQVSCQSALLQCLKVCARTPCRVYECSARVGKYPDSTETDIDTIRIICRLAAAPGKGFAQDAVAKMFRAAGFNDSARIRDDLIVGNQIAYFHFREAGSIVACS